jgi:hypothetical protein
VEELVKKLEELLARVDGIADEMTYYEIDTAVMARDALQCARTLLEIGEV